MSRKALRWLAIAAAIIVMAAMLGVFRCGDLKRFAYEGFGRDRWQMPEQVMASLGIAPGTTAADIGAGGGYFTFRLARAAGPQGKVYAVDVDSDMLDHLRQRAAREGFANVEVVRGEFADPKLPPGQTDLVFMCNTYHHIEGRTAYFQGVRKYLRPGGRVAIVEFKPEGWLQKLFKHATSRETMRQEMHAAGYEVAEEFDYLPKQHFLVFSLSPDASPQPVRE